TSGCARSGAATDPPRASTSRLPETDVRIAVVGAHGQLAAAVIHECRQAHEIVAFTRAALDVTDDAAVAAALETARPDAIVNGAAYTDVDGAEDHPIEALNVNAFA